jgi:hypothetical protein
MPRSILLLLLSSVVSAFCPWYGPVFPPPTKLASSATFQTALQKLKSAYDVGLIAGNSSTGTIPGSSVVGVHIFSVDSEEPIFEYYHDSPILNTTVGVKTLDGDAIIRVGSISKLLAVYLLLNEAGDGWWDVPIADVIPELNGDKKWKEDDIDFVDWDAVTIGALAGQNSGLPAYCKS